MLERDELRLRREPLREGLAPSERAIETLELERTIVKDPHVVSIHRPLAHAAARLAPPGHVEGRRDGQIFEIDEKFHHPRHILRISRLGFPVHRTRIRQALDAASEIGSGDHRATEEEKPLFGNGNVFVELELHVGSEHVGYETEVVVKVGGMYELQYGQDKLGR